jgi:hypothetical protein
MSRLGRVLEAAAPIVGSIEPRAFTATGSTEGEAR